MADGIKKEDTRIYSDAKGDLAKHLGYIDTNAALLRRAKACVGARRTSLRPRR
jgi:hypothetical protein